MGNAFSIFNVRIDNITRQEILEKTEKFLKTPQFHHIATINPEFLLRANQDQIFRDLLNGCDLNIADGVGIHFAFWHGNARLKARFPGADLLDYILQQTQNLRLKVFLVARKDGLSDWKETAEAIRKRYPNVEVNGMDVSIFATETSPEEMALFQKMIEYDVVLCNFGAPYQEIFLADIRNNPGNVRLAVGLGGAFDFLTGKRRRAPLWMRQFGLEWFWRLLLEPSRLGRIIKATILFPIKVTIEKKKAPNPY